MNLYSTAYNTGQQQWTEYNTIKYSFKNNRKINGNNSLTKSNELIRHTVHFHKKSSF